MTSADPLLTVVIPTWNRSALLRKCLSSLAAQSVACLPLVVDDGSQDETAAMVRREFPEARLLRLERNSGFARAVNQGVQATETPYVALLNNDTEADPGWAEAGLKALRENPGYSFFACRMLNARFPDRLDGAGDCYNRRGLPYKRGWGGPADSFPHAEPVLGASGGAAFYRRRLFDEIGLLDEDFHMYLEDVEFSLRAQTRGRRCLYLPDAVVRHWEAASDPESDLASHGEAPRALYSRRRVFWITRNRWLLMVLYQPARHAPHLALGWLKSFLFHLLKVGATGAFLRGIAAGLRATPRAWRKRLRGRRERTMTTAQLCELLRRC